MWLGYHPEPWSPGGTLWVVEVTPTLDWGVLAAPLLPLVTLNKLFNLCGLSVLSVQQAGYFLPHG